MPARAFTALAGLALLATLFLPWYAFDVTVLTRGAAETEDPVSVSGTFSAWEAFAAFDVLLATLAIAVVLLAARRLAAAATALAAVALVVVALRLVWRVDSDFDVGYGAWLALAAALAALVAARGIGGRT